MGNNFIGAFNASSASGFVDGVNGDRVGTPTAPIDPLAGPLRNNGGPNSTHGPPAGSPLVDAANQVLFPLTDQRGAPRVGGGVDIGAVDGGVPNITMCTGVPNSSGRIGSIATAGSLDVANDSLSLFMYDIPTQVFGIFIASPQSAAPVSPPGSIGQLCLGGSIGRFVGPGQVQSSGAEGVIALSISLSSIPQGNGSVVAMPGATWFFQGWPRDVAGGTNTSNDSQGIGVTLQ